MLDDYPAQVKAAYLKMCRDGMASVNLRKPTPGSLQKECIVVYRRKNGLIDRDIIRTFLEIRGEDNLESEIRRAGLNKFRAVQNFLIREVPNPRYETIEFIAWLIDFRLTTNDNAQIVNENQTESSSSLQNPTYVPVPVLIVPETAQANEEPIEPRNIKGNENFEEATDDTNCQEPKVELITIDEGEGGVEMKNGGVTIKENIPPVIAPPQPNKFTALAILVAILLVEGTIAYFGFYQEKTFIRIVPVKKECMYWTGEHYEAVSCDSVVVGQQNIIPFHLDEWKYMRKITRPDTLTSNDIGKVWYIKIKNDPEIFTFNGRYPLDTNRVLKPLSQHIYETYIPKKKEVALLRNRLISGGIAFVVTLSVGTWWLFVALIRRRKRL